MSTIEALKLCAEDIKKGVLKLINNAHPPKTAPDRPRFALFLTISEQFEATLLLINAGMATHAATHVRSMTEALVDMYLLEKKDAYINQMQYDKLKGEKNFYAKLLTETYLSDESKNSIEEQRINCISSFEQLHQSGVRPKKITDGFNETGLSHLIPSYIMLCNFSHNDLSILALRHQGENSMTYMAPVEDEIIKGIMSVAIEVVMNASSKVEKIALFPKSTFKETFEIMNKSWEETMED